MMGRPAGIRKARTALSVADKMKVLDELKAGKPAVDVAAEFEISRRQVFNILKHSDAVVKCITRRIGVRSMGQGGAFAPPPPPAYPSLLIFKYYNYSSW